MNAPATEPDEQWSMLLETAGRKVWGGESAADFLTWFTEYAPTIVPGLFAKIDSPAVARSAAATIGRALWNKLPQPRFDWRPKPLPSPGRNNPCPCGSGRKFKQCCQAHPVPNVLLENMNLLRWVLDAVPRSRFDQVPVRKLSPEALVDTAQQWLQENKVERAVALLEPLFEQPASLDCRHGQAFDLLMDGWQTLHRPRKREALVQALFDHRDLALASGARQRKVTMLADDDKWDAAWALFAESLRRDPNNPGFAHLEVALLMQQQRMPEAVARAQFWSARLRKLSPDYHALADVLVEMASKEPSESLLDLAGGNDPFVQALRAALEAAPVPIKAYTLDIAEGQASLVPSTDLRRLQARWHKRFPVGKPKLTHLAGEAHAVIESLDDVCEFLSSHPLAWQSFDVLDDLVIALDMLRNEREYWSALIARCTDRAEQLLRIHLSSEFDPHGDTPQVVLPWSYMSNRPALRLLAFGIDLSLGDMARQARATKQMRWLLRLNPNDNHGYREIVGEQLLKAGHAAEAIELLDHYQNDPGTTLANRVLARVMLGKTDEAAKILQRDGYWLREIRRALLAARYAKPRDLDPTQVSLGGADEAWFYRDSMRAVWQASGALIWLRAQPASLLMAERAGSVDDTTESGDGPPLDALAASGNRAESTFQPEYIPTVVSRTAGAPAFDLAAASKRNDPAAAKQAADAYRSLGADPNWLQGLLTAVAMSPKLTMPALWLPVVLAPPGMPAITMGSLDAANTFLGVLMAWHNQIIAKVTEALGAARQPETDTNTAHFILDRLMPEFNEEAKAESLRIAAAWASGFVSLIELDRSPWRKAVSSGAIKPIEQLAAIAQGGAARAREISEPAQLSLVEDTDWGAALRTAVARLALTLAAHPYWRERLGAR